MKEIHFDKDRNKYFTKLPFKPYHDVIPDNHSLCVKRLGSVRRKLQRDPKLMQDYCDIFKDYEEKRIIERVPVEDTGTPGAVHYIAHHPVIRVDRETTKVRPVFDASAKDGSTSLNENLYTGPNLLARIQDILLRFRSYKIVVLSDIQQAFLQVGIHEEHADFLRFLMIDPDNPDETISYRFLTAVFGVTSSTFLLEATLQYHCNGLVQQGLVDPKFVESFLRNLYVDDSMGATGARTVNEGFEWYKTAKHVMKLGGFNLRKWCTNNSELQQLIDHEECVPSPTLELVPAEDNVSFSQHQLPSVGSTDQNLKGVLGVTWNLAEDEIIFDLTEIIAMGESIKPTKRNLLRVAYKFYDPNGLISPISIQAKMILQLVHKENLDLDDTVSDSLKKTWTSFIACLKERSTIRVPRFIDLVVTVDTSLQIHGFCDASKLAYCAAVYIRRESSLEVKVNLLTSKTKVAPIKEVSVPRLELLSCLLLVELLQAVTNALSELQDTETFYWSDSEIALGWIRGVHKQWKPWVEDRAVKIRKKSKQNSDLRRLKNWRHISGDVNPADIATRPISPKDLYPDSPWFIGPRLLYLPKEDWPNEKINEDITLELKQEKVIPTNFIQHQDCELEIPVHKYSSIHRVVNIGMYVLRFKNNLLARIRNKDPQIGEFTVTEIENAEKLLIKEDQMFIKKSTKFKQLEKSLNLFTDSDGLLRAAGRLKNADLQNDAKFPILLRDAPLAHLFIRESHREVMHDGPSATLNQFRNRFWVVRGRQVVRRTIYRCVTCKRNQGKTMAPPPSPALPEYRLVSDYCFQSTGVDFAGPLFVKPIYSSEAKELFKAHICLFTCATSRAIHLELVPNLEGPTFIRAMRRFIGRRGFPKLLVSDNAKTFTSNVLKSFLMKHKIEKDFILAAAPWWGGFYERLVRSVKGPLRKTLGKARLTYEEMETILIEVECVVNSRPLTYMEEDNVTEPLTPSHLLTGRNIMKHPVATARPRICHLDLVNRTRYLQQLMILFWNKFRKCYLAELREHHMHQSKRIKTDTNASLAVDDVVVIKDDDFSPRSSWRIGRVDSLIQGRDGMVRGGVIATVSKDGKRGKMTRPVQKLIPLEVRPNEGDNSAIVNDSSPSSNVSDVTSGIVDPDVPTSRIPSGTTSGVLPDTVSNTGTNVQRPQRVAAVAGEKKRRLNVLK